MRKPIIVSVIMAVTLLAWSFPAPTQPQNPATEEKPTFYRLVPGVYVNGWPRFTVTYPKDWIERPLMAFAGEAFGARAPGPARFPGFGVVVVPWPLPIDKAADTMAQVYRTAGAQDVTVVGDKPSQLRDGTPAREVELNMVRNGIPVNVLALAVKEGDLVIHVDVGRLTEKIEENLKTIPYSLEFQPGKDEPVKVPPDVQEFLDRDDNDIVSHDVAKVTSHFSERYLNSGVRKGEMERFWRQNIGGITLSQKVITDFEAAGDRAHLTGFVNTNFGGNPPIRDTSIIKENGEWKW